MTEMIWDWINAEALKASGRQKLPEEIPADWEGWTYIGITGRVDGEDEGHEGPSGADQLGPGRGPILPLVRMHGTCKLARKGTEVRQQLAK